MYRCTLWRVILNILTKAVAKFIIGESTGVKIRGTPGKIRVTKDVILASKALYEELNSSDPKLDKVIDLMKAKNDRASKFMNTTGLVWRL